MVKEEHPFCGGLGDDFISWKDLITIREDYYTEGEGDKCMLHTGLKTNQYRPAGRRGWCWSQEVWTGIRWWKVLVGLYLFLFHHASNYGYFIFPALLIWLWALRKWLGNIFCFLYYPLRLFFSFIFFFFLRNSTFLHLPMASLSWASLITQLEEDPIVMQETPVPSLVRKIQLRSRIRYPLQCSGLPSPSW